MRVRLISFLALTVIFSQSEANSAESSFAKVCVGDEASLSRAAGEYVSGPFLQTLRETRSVEDARKRHHDSAFAIVVQANNILQTDWHEATELQCVEIDGKTLKVPGIDTIFTRVSQRNTFADTGDYFDILFSGCFTETTSRERWCFSPNRIDVSGQTYKAMMSLDLSETWGKTPVQINSEDSPFWYFIPTSSGGWHVFQGGWASDGSPEPDWSKPWRILER